MSRWLIPLRLALLWALAVLSANVKDRVVIGLAVALTAAVGYWEWHEHSRALSQATCAKRFSGFIDERVTALRPVLARLIARLTPCCEKFSTTVRTRWRSAAPTRNG